MASPIDRLNAIPEREFVGEMTAYFEGGPRFLTRLAIERPFRNSEDLFARAEALALGMTEAEQVELVNGHPRIGAAPGSMSAASLREQGHGAAERADAGATARMSLAELQAELDRLNAAYEARFGFRCVVFVAGRSRSAIVPVIESRLGSGRDAELRTGVTDVCAIARDRWHRAHGDAA